AETRQYLERMIAAQGMQPRTIWELAVVQQSDDRLVGACDLTLDQPGEADLGFVFAREVWGRGYASEIAGALVHAAVQQIGVGRVFATGDVANHASARVLERAGLKRLARLERHRFARDAWCTSYLYAVRRDEWLAAAPRTLAATDNSSTRDD